MKNWKRRTGWGVGETLCSERNGRGRIELLVTSCWAVIGSVPKWLVAREGQLMKTSFWKKGTYYTCVPQFGVLEIVCLFRVVKFGPTLGLIFGTGSGTGIEIGSLLRTGFSILLMCEMKIGS